MNNKKNTGDKLTIEINKRENEKKKILLDNKIRIKQKESKEKGKLHEMWKLHRIPISVPVNEMLLAHSQASSFSCGREA